tara:strand:- start:3469 stop:4152 length:684 start_codon:yes stop_codon:yes gene_type:complete
LFSFEWHKFGSGNTLTIFLPGLMGASRELQAFGSSAYHVYLSYDRDVGDYQSFCLALYQQLRRWSEDYQLHVVGYSMGGRFLVSLLQFDCRFIQSFTFISASLPVLEPKQRYLKQCFIYDVSQRLLEMPPFDFCQYWYSLPIYGSALSKDESFLNRRVTTFDAQHVLACLHAYSALKMPFYINPVNHVAMRYVYGEQDQKYKAMGASFQALFSIELTEVPGSGHLCY